MTPDEVKASLAKAARRCWPGATRASDLPFPDYWKAVTEWLTFHAPHVCDRELRKFIDGFTMRAKEAEERGEAPAAPTVPESVRRIWENEKPEERAESPARPIEERPAAGEKPAAPARRAPAAKIWQGRLM